MISGAERHSSRANGGHAMKPLFQGTVHFVNVTFNVTSENVSFSVSAQDMTTIVQYATKVATPISLYADQYGESALIISQNVIPLSVNLSARSCTDAQVRSWVTSLASQLAGKVCIAIILPPQIDNSSQSRASGDGGYHSSVSGITYLNAYMAANYDPAKAPLTVQDTNFVVLGHLSHEMAEMTVNPTGGNPEVCDPCGPNYNSTYLSYFDADGNYIQTTQTPPYDVNFPFGFYMNAVVDPAHSQPKTAPAAACSYPPIKVSEATLSQIATAVRCDGFYSADDHVRHAVVGLTNGDISHIAYSPKTGQSSSSLGQTTGLLDLAGFYTADDKFRHVLTAASSGAISEIFFHAGQGQSIIANIPGAKRVSGFYSDDDQFRHAIVASGNGTITEVFYHPTKGNGQTQIGSLQSVVDIGSFYSPDDHYRHVIVATADGNLTEIYYQPKFGISQTVVANLPGVQSVTAFYVPGLDFSRRIQATDDKGILFEFRYSVDFGVTKCKLNSFSSILDLGGFYSADDKMRHAILLDNTATLREDYYAT
jgi:hypothetical protein